MKGSALVLFGFVLCTGSAFSQTESEIRDRIVGTWKLVSTEETMKNGTTRPFPSFGPRAKGFLMYQRDGHMCADLVNPDRPAGYVGSRQIRPYRFEGGRLILSDVEKDDPS